MTTSIEKEILVDVLTNPGDIFYESVLSDFLDEQGIEHDFRKPLHNNPITELRLYHEKYFEIWKNHWVNVGLYAKITDENKAEQYIYSVYKQLGLEKPKNIVWCNNPIEMHHQVLRKSKSLKWMLIWNKAKSKLWDQVYNQVKDQVEDQVWNDIYYKIVNQMWGSEQFDLNLGKSRDTSRKILSNS
jgi:hypothetical protein